MAGRHFSNAKIKKELKRNELIEAWEQGSEWVRGHLEVVIVAAVAVVLVAVVVPLWAKGRTEREAKAAQMLMEIGRQYDTPAGDEGGAGYGGPATAREKYTQVQTRYRELATSYPSSASAVLAELGVVHCDLRMGDAAKAEAGYRDFLGKRGGSPYAGYASAGLGQALVLQGKPADAAQVLEKAADMPGVPNLAQLLEDAAQAWILAGDRTKALALYERLAKGGLGIPESAAAKAKAKLPNKAAKA